MFRCKPLLPIDIEFWVHLSNVADVSFMKYVAKVPKWIKWAFQQVTTFNEKEITHAQKCYDQNVRCSVLAPGDLVLVCIKAFKGKHKVLNQWESVPYEVVRHIRDSLPVHKVRQRDSNQQSWVLHQNMLILLNQCCKSESSKIIPVDLCLVDSSCSDNVSSSCHTGPVTHSQTKLQGLLKANLLMNECFEISVNFTRMKPHSYSLKTLIADYFWLQMDFLG